MKGSKNKENKPRFLIATGIYPPDIGGPATYSKLLYERLPQHGFDVEVLSFGRVRSLPKIIRHSAYFFLLLQKGISKDIIYAQDPVSVGFPALLASKILRTKFLLKVVGDYAWEQGTTRFGVNESLDTFSKVKSGYHFFVMLLKKVEYVVAKGADRIIVPSNYLKRVVQNWGIPGSKISVIYNAFNPPERIAGSEILRQMMNIEGKLIITVGRLVPWKGFEALIDIMPDVIKLQPKTRLFIVGSGVDEEKLQKKVTELGLEDTVSLTGMLDHETLLRYIQASDLFILNTFYEGFSHQLLECMALNTPLITTSVGGNTEIIDHKTNGLLVPYNDKKELIKAIQTAFDDEVGAKNMARNALNKVKQFNEETMLKELFEVLQKV